MVVLKTIEEWQIQSALLLQARPTTARVSTKYNIPNLDSAKYQKSKKRKRESENDEANAAPRVPRAVLSLKTYDPESGVCLQFKTDKASDVGRLVGGLGRLGRHMAALPVKTEDVAMADAVPAEKAVQEQNLTTAEAPISTDNKQQQQQQSAGKKKKKGKR